MQKASQRICGKQISTDPLFRGLSGQNAIDASGQAAATNRQSSAHLRLAAPNIHILGPAVGLHRECLLLTERGIPGYFEDLQSHGLLIGNAVNPAYWLIWVISEENVSNLCRKCCNWIFATRIIWRSTPECMRRPPTLCWTGANICSLNGPAALQRRVNFQIS